MKCPKCDYLGFETGDRCKNCGYDFSLSAVIAAPANEADLLLRAPEPFSRDADRWLNQLEARLDNVRPAALGATTDGDPLGSMRLDRPATQPPAPVAETASPTPSASPAAPVVTASVPVHRPVSKAAQALPLFSSAAADSDEPLIKVPAAPRPPLAVRRTPDRPRLRTVPKPVRKANAEHGSDPVLAFAEEAMVTNRPRAQAAASKKSAAPIEVSGPVRRFTAAAVDTVILLAIDAVVIYFTFQIAGLAFSSWRRIPILPMALFLALVKVSYFSVFTMLGGQTVGKMATRIRVVAENDRDVEPAQALQRTLAALASVATIGIGFAPVLLGGDRRALHDRVAGTRVVGPVHE